MNETIRLCRPQILTALKLKKSKINIRPFTTSSSDNQCSFFFFFFLLDLTINRDLSIRYSFSAALN